MLQTPFPFLPDQAVVISKHCALVRQDGQIAVLNAASVFFCIREHDRQGRRTALGMLEHPYSGERDGVGRRVRRLARHRVSVQGSVSGRWR